MMGGRWPTRKFTVAGSEAAIRLLMAAMVWDFWVTEERQKVFEITTRRRAGASSRVEANQQRASSTYREFDTRQAALGSVGLPKDFSLRRETRHYVKPFLRKVENPSPLQIEIARRDRFYVPAGFTYVRGHYRGGGASTEAVYRSRSAMNLLYEARRASVCVVGLLSAAFR